MMGTSRKAGSWAAELDKLLRKRIPSRTTVRLVERMPGIPPHARTASRPPHAALVTISNEGPHALSTSDQQRGTQL
jgi:hypothetical protein